MKLYEWFSKFIGVTRNISAIFYIYIGVTQIVYGKTCDHNAFSREISLHPPQ